MRSDPPHWPPGPERVGVRDMDRIREKVTLRLEPRHAVLAGLGGILLLVAVFTLGVLVGRSCDQVVTASSSPIKAPTGLANKSPPLLDQPLPARRNEVRPLNVAPPPPRGPSDTVDIETARRGPDEVRGVHPVIENDNPWAALAISDPCQIQSCALPQGCDAPGPTLDEVRAALARYWLGLYDLWRCAHEESDSSPRFLCKLRSQIRSKPWKTLSRWLLLAVQAPKPTTVPSSPAPRTANPLRTSVPAHPTALASGWFTVQVRSYRDEAMAHEFAQSLRAEGYSVEVARHEDGSQAWFRVRVGRFPTLSEARDFARRLNERTGDRAIVTAMEAR